MCFTFLETSNFYLPYRHQLNPGVLFFNMDFWMGFKSNLGAFCQNLLTFTILVDSKLDKTHCSARGEVVTKNGVQLTLIRYLLFAFNT